MRFALNPVFVLILILGNSVNPIPPLMTFTSLIDPLSSKEIVISAPLDGVMTATSPLL